MSFASSSTTMGSSTGAVREACNEFLRDLKKAQEIVLARDLIDRVGAASDSVSAINLIFKAEKDHVVTPETLERAKALFRQRFVRRATNEDTHNEPKVSSSKGCLAKVKSCSLAIFSLFVAGALSAMAAYRFL